MWKPIVTRYVPGALAIVLLLYALLYLGRGEQDGNLAQYNVAPPRDVQTSEASSYWQGWSDIEYLFAFGDSYTCTGWDTKSTRPNDDNPFGNPDWPLQTLKDGKLFGPVWVHYLATIYNASRVYVYDYAQGGATVDEDIVAPMYKIIRPFREQVEVFLTRFVDTTPFTPHNALFMALFGINDILGSMKQHAKDIPFTVLFLSYRKQLDDLYAQGARNFLLLNVPPFYRASPNQLTMEASKEEEQVGVIEWNAWLRRTRDKFVKESPGATAFLFDAHAFWSDVLEDVSITPETAGIKVTQGSCEAYKGGAIDHDMKSEDCDYKMNEYFWLDQLHPTSTTHNATAARIFRDCFGQNRTGYCS